jgi:hypothetical protein
MLKIRFYQAWLLPGLIRFGASNAAAARPARAPPGRGRAAERPVGGKMSNSVNLSDMLIAGKPSLVVAGSSHGAEMIVKEAMWKMGREPRVLDLEFCTPESLNTDWNSYNSGDFILVVEARSADQETQLAFLELMRDPDKTVAVASSCVPDHMPADKFSFFGKF